MFEEAGADNQKATRCMQGGNITQRDIFIVKRGRHVKNGPCISTNFKRDDKCCFNCLQVAKNEEQSSHFTFCFYVLTRREF